MNHELYDLREICGRHYTYCEVTLKSFAVPDDLSRTLWVTIYIWITNCMIARHLWALSHILWSHSDVICGARWFVTNFISYYLYTNHELNDRETFVGVITHTVESRWSHLRCQMICHELCELLFKYESRTIWSRDICGRYYTYCGVTLKSFAVPDDLSRTLWVTIYIWITNYMIARHLWALLHILWSHAEVICGARWFVTNFGAPLLRVCIWIYHVTHFNASRGTYAWVMSRIWVRQVARALYGGKVAGLIWIRWPSFSGAR